MIAQGGQFKGGKLTAFVHQNVKACACGFQWQHKMCLFLNK